jgi:hypothetical protein
MSNGIPLKWPHSTGSYTVNCVQTLKADADEGVKKDGGAVETDTFDLDSVTQSTSAAAGSMGGVAAAFGGAVGAAITSVVGAAVGGAVAGGSRSAGTVLVFRQDFALEDAIGSHLKRTCV